LSFGFAYEAGRGRGTVSAIHARGPPPPAIPPDISSHYRVSAKFCGSQQTQVNAASKFIGAEIVCN
jgi:hypothetical protein